MPSPLQLLTWFWYGGAFLAFVTVCGICWSDIGGEMASRFTFKEKVGAVIIFISIFMLVPISLVVPAIGLVKGRDEMKFMAATALTISLIALASRWVMGYPL